MRRWYLDVMARDLPPAFCRGRWLVGPNMSNTTLIAIAFLAISIGHAEAKDKHRPACTASNSVVEVLGDKCFLVKGWMIYGDIAELSQIVRLN